VLLDRMDRDLGNLALRKDAIREACDTHLWHVARSLIDAGLQAHPRDSELLSFSGLVCLQAQSYPQAVQALTGALAQGLEAAEVRYNLAYAHFMATRHSDALEQLTDSVVAQVLPFALLLRARCLHHLNRPLEAIADCQAYLSLAADDAEASGLLALMLHEQDRGEEAQLRIDEALSKDPSQLEALLTRALREADVKNYREARGCFDVLLHAHPLCGLGWLGLALVELHLMEFEEAHRCIRFAAVRIPHHVGTWHGLAWTEILSRDLLAAQIAFERALVLDRKSGETYGGLAVVAALQRREQDARDLSRVALHLNSKSMSARYANVLLLECIGESAQASSAYDAMLAIPVPRSDQHYRDLAVLHVMSRRHSAGEGSSAAALSRATFMEPT
jgi:tetratricopeptide (TPR) repeat protein